VGNLSNLSWVRPLNNAIGPGGATINNGVTLDIASGNTNAIDDNASIRLHGRGRHDAAKFRLNANVTIGRLWVDNTVGDGSASVQLPAGQYTATSSPNGPAITCILGNALIGGTGTLAVLYGPPQITDMHQYALDNQSPGASLDGNALLYSHKMRRDDSALVYLLQTRTNLLSGEWVDAGMAPDSTLVTGTDYDDVHYRIPITQTNRFFRLLIYRGN
jgi:hypothetical protein